MRLIPNHQIRQIVDWFQRQRTNRTKMVTMDLFKNPQVDGQDQEENDSSGEEDFGHLQKQIESAIADFESRQKLEDRKQADDLKALQDSSKSQVEKFDKAKHVGTVFDPSLNRRVPVSDVNQLPTLKHNAEIIMELSHKKQQEDQLMKEKQIQQLAAQTHGPRDDARHDEASRQSRRRMSPDVATDSASLRERTDPKRSRDRQPSASPEAKDGRRSETRKKDRDHESRRRDHRDRYRDHHKDRDTGRRDRDRRDRKHRSRSRSSDRRYRSSKKHKSDRKYKR